MDFKVINIDGDQVCIRRDRTDEGESVVVSAFLQDDEGCELLQEYEYAFNSTFLAVGSGTGYRNGCETTSSTCTR
jgi:hypothetical protein